MTTRLAHQTQKASGIPSGMRTATVVSVSSTGVTINLNGGLFTSGVGVLTSYAPVVGDTVNVFRQDSSWLILGPSKPSPYGQWVRFSTLGYQNSWTDRGTGYPAGQYRVTASEVQIIGQLNNATIPAAGSVIVSGLPTPGAEVVVCVAAQGATTPSLHVDAAGALRIYGNSTSGLMQFSGTYPLDCIIA